MRLKNRIIKNTFHKSERLCGKKNIDVLFEKGSAFSVYPVKLMYLPVDTSGENRAMFVVPKRSFKKAHDRNKLKRRMKESYRLNKRDFYNALKEKTMHMAFIYTGRKEETYKVISAAVISALEKLVSKA